MENIMNNENVTLAMLTVIGIALENGMEASKHASIAEVFEAACEYITENEIGAIEEECEVVGLGNRQRVDHDDFWCQGEIVDFSAHWHKAPETKIFHSQYVNELGQLVKLFYLVGETEYNAPDGYYFDRSKKAHLKTAQI